MQWERCHHGGMGNRWVRTAVVLVSTTIALAGCSSGGDDPQGLAEPSAADEAASLPGPDDMTTPAFETHDLVVDWDSPPIGPMRRDLHLGGELSADGSSLCTWVVVRDQLLEVVWPDGTVIEPEPLHVVDSPGHGFTGARAGASLGAVIDRGVEQDGSCTGEGRIALITSASPSGPEPSDALPLVGPLGEELATRDASIEVRGTVDEGFCPTVTADDGSVYLPAWPEGTTVAISGGSYDLLDLDGQAIIRGEPVTVVGRRSLGSDAIFASGLDTWRAVVDAGSSWLGCHFDALLVVESIVAP